jgi:hypothetical protein
MTGYQKFRESWWEVRKIEIKCGRSELLRYSSYREIILYRDSWREIKKTEINDGRSEIRKMEINDGRSEI